MLPATPQKALIRSDPSTHGPPKAVDPELQDSTQTGVEDQQDRNRSNSPDLRDDEFITLLQAPGES
ncbi:hypothetical protein PGTUg99_031265 [Puccinia graminis f. sp. tritici]|uniref:Uncharacterized protein n=1 Tax=Puccinia graminis f. sp. tritici TaxID=56615 RepID=A0A5B0Q9P8_PUCGR|nr:hypothetical protein PGTUg99_031265 [Puccinia graminis f. sp. tritici]